MRQGHIAELMPSGSWSLQATAAWFNQTGRCGSFTTLRGGSQRREDRGSLQTCRHAI